jgi:hypothetical protein
MSAKLSKSTIDMGSGENPALAAFETWMSFNRPMVSAWTEFNGRMIEQAAQANNEWLSFLGRRMNEDMVMSKRFLDCRTLQEVTALYAEFLQRAQKQYQDEFQHFARLNQKLADETATIVRSHLEDAGAEMRH